MCCSYNDGMWRKTYTIGAPKMYFADSKGEYHHEYIPDKYPKYVHWLRDKHIGVRERFGKDIYYWHIRHHHEPEFRKMQDLAFILHVIDDHDQEVIDKIEKKHYKKAWRLYGHEIKFVVEDLGLGLSKGWKKNGLDNGYPYVVAYAEKWLDNDPQVEAKMLYHGISYLQYLDLLQILTERYLKLRNDYAKAHGLDPETGLKLKPKKKKG